VSLALFGQTPRLAEKKGKADFDAHLVMSRGTARASAQLEFTKAEGGLEQRYRATWTCRRARGKADGNPQDAVRTIERWDGGDWVELASSHQKKVFGPAFDEVLEKMNVEDFKRTVLLAQGEFAAFLQVDDDERARILERLTNTEQYKRIGKRAAERMTAAKAAAESARALADKFPGCTPEQEQALIESLQKATDDEARLRQDKERVEAALGWRKAVDDSQLRLDQGLREEAAAVEELEAHAPELRRLAEHERCQGAAALLAGSKAASTRLEAERASRGALEIGRADQHAELLREENALHEANVLRQERQRVRDEAQPAIVEARRLRAVLVAAVAELQDARKLSIAARAKREQCDKRLGLLQGAEKKACDAQQEAEAAVAALEPFRDLVDRIGLLEVQHASLVESMRSVESLRQERSESAKALETCRQDSAALQERLARLQQGVEAANDAVARTQALLSETLGEHPDPAAMRRSLEEDANAARQMQSTLASALRLLGEVRSAQVQQAASASTSATKRNEAEQIAASIAADEAAVAELVAGLESRRQTLEHLSWARGIARERDRLRSGEDCPLCGSKEHPAIDSGDYAEEDRRIGEHCDALEAELVSLEEQRKRIEKGLKKQRKEHAEAEGKAVAEDRLAAEYAAAANKALSALRETEATAGVPLGDDATIERLGVEVDAKLGEISGRRDRLEQLTKAVSDAQANLQHNEREQAQEQADATKNAARTAELQAKLSEIDKQEQRTATEIAKGSASLRSALEPFGLFRDGVELADSLRDARVKVESLKRADATRLELRNLLVAARSDREKAEVVQAEAADSARTALDKEQERSAAEELCRHHVAEALEGRDPDVVQGELDEAVKQASLAVDALRAKTSALREALGATDARIAEAKRRCAEGAEELDSLSRQLQNSLQELGIAGAEELEARLLDEPTRERLFRDRTRWERKRQDTATLTAERRGALEAVLARKPEGADETAALEVLESQTKEAGERWDEAVRAKAAREAEGARMEGDRRKAAELHEAWQAAQREADLWGRLHELIGTNNGGAFQLYAQTLNLQELVRRANVHLGRLSDRYSLCRAEGRLAFAIRDEWQAGQSRPLTTLSGGETFLVSLALALALADYRTVSMPIETLLLDEGFGTLDEETLGTAMQALESLHAAGMQVGVISHVEALKEKIPARIHVEKMGNGRSRVVVGRG
ncbi:MAG TPA: SbcC/MukB-like Walker B domain-containing protein, partial [Polyangiaceae bacterium]|nr:SbcC/MukB-like Walker B domain-containing protein [Polyangiaceae bacterium]